jgi:hypothetical protein
LLQWFIPSGRASKRASLLTSDIWERYPGLEPTTENHVGMTYHPDVTGH